MIIQIKKTLIQQVQPEFYILINAQIISEYFELIGIRYLLKSNKTCYLSIEWKHYTKNKLFGHHVSNYCHSKVSNYIEVKYETKQKI